MRTCYKSDGREDKNKGKKLSLIKLILVNKYCKQWKIWPFSAQSLFFFLESFTETLIKHLQLYLPCFGNNRFKSNIKKVFTPNTSI